MLNLFGQQIKFKNAKTKPIFIRFTMDLLQKN